MEKTHFRVYLSDLTEDKFEEIKQDIIERLKLDDKLVEEIEAKVRDEMAEDEEEVTKDKLKWRIDEAFEEEALEVIKKTYYCEGEVGD